MSEDENNIQFICKKCAPKPLGLKQATDDLIGKHVKVAFNGNAPDGSLKSEHMWFFVVSRFGNQINGELRSEPVLKFPEQFKLGAMVVFHVSEIEDIDDRGDNDHS